MDCSQPQGHHQGQDDHRQGQFLRGDQRCDKARRFYWRQDVPGRLLRFGIQTRTRYQKCGAGFGVIGWAVQQVFGIGAEFVAAVFLRNVRVQQSDTAPGRYNNLLPAKPLGIIVVTIVKPVLVLAMIVLP